jgi:uncharacterized small protein (DUF1192 family)
MVNEYIALLAVVATTLGAFLSTWKGKISSGQPYDTHQLISSVITAVFASYATINFPLIGDQIEQLGFVGVFLLYLTGGYFLDQKQSNLDFARTRTISKRASDGITRQLDGIIAFLQKELAQSKAELEKARTMAMPNEEFRKIYIDLLQKEIDRTTRQIQYYLDYKQQLLNEGWTLP